MTIYEAIQMLRHVMKTHDDPHLSQQGEKALYTLLDDRKTLQAARMRLSQSPEDRTLRQWLDEYERQWNED